jgi:hypothetical protein
MPLRIKCPTGHTLIVPDDRAGRTLRCPRCSQAVVVPGQKPETAVEPRVPPPLPIGPPPLRAAELPPVGSAPVELPPPLPLIEQPTPPPFEPAGAVPPPLPAATLAEEPPPAPSEVGLAAWESSAELSAQFQPPRELDPPAPSRFPPIPPAVAAAPPPVTVDLHADAHNVLVVYQLAAALVAAALFSVAPAVWDVVDYIRVYQTEFASPQTHFVARWALVLFFLGIVQIGYAVYLFQLPDWTSVWVVTMVSLLLAALYAGVLGLVLITRDDGWIVQSLQLADKLAGGKAALWCLAMVCLSTILAFFSGRLSVKWHKAEMLLRQA